MVAGFVLALTVVAAAADDGFSTGVSSYADLHHFEDAEVFLSSVGIEAGLPQLDVKYDEGGWGRKRTIKGSETHLVVGTKVSLDKMPSVTWEGGTQRGETKRKYAILMIDPDWPRPNRDASKAGSEGPFLHWFGINCEEDAKSCHELMPYSGPHPSQGEHRYIFLLLRQLRPPPRSSVLTDYVMRDRRMKFDLGGFLEAIDGAMVPVALNLFYARAKEEDDDDDERPTSSTSSSTPPPPAALEPPVVPQGSGARGLGAAWKSRPADGAHDEL